MVEPLLWFMGTCGRNYMRWRPQPRETKNHVHLSEPWPTLASAAQSHPWSDPQQPCSDWVLRDEYVIGGYRKRRGRLTRRGSVIGVAVRVARRCREVYSVGLTTKERVGSFIDISVVVLEYFPGEIPIDVAHYRHEQVDLFVEWVDTIAAGRRRHPGLRRGVVDLSCRGGSV